MENHSTTQDGSHKLNIPLNSQLYKVVRIDKNGFLITILNINTLAEQTVLHSRLKSLQLHDLESLSLSQPELFDRLVVLRRTLRNMYIPGRHTQSELYQIPFHAKLASSETVPQQDEEDQLEEDESTGDGAGMVLDGASGEQLEPVQGAGPGFNRPAEEDRVAEEDLH